MLKSQLTGGKPVTSEISDVEFCRACIQTDDIAGCSKRNATRELDFAVPNIVASRCAQLVNVAASWSFEISLPTF